MCGIFAYLNFLTPKMRREVLEMLIGGLQRLEYRGYDSAGVGIDSADSVVLIKRKGKVAELRKSAFDPEVTGLDYDESLNNTVGIAHTRWATHGEPSEKNCHPHRSDESNRFIVVHNGIITNYNDIKEFLVKQGYVFESETDTEVMAKMIEHLHEKNPHAPFRQLVELLIQQLEGAFACAFKSRMFPGEIVCTRRGSPLLVGIKTANDDLATDSIPIQFSLDEDRRGPAAADNETSDQPQRKRSTGRTVFRVDSGAGSTSEISPSKPGDAVEYFFASDASAIIEHTNKVIYLEDEDVASVKNGVLSIHRLGNDGNTPTDREVTTLKMKLQQIMKGDYEYFMQKEIFEQPESITRTMAGRVPLEGYNVTLGGIKDFIPEIKRCRRLLLIGCGTSYNSALATRQLLEELTQLPVMLDLASDFLDRTTPIFRDDVCFFISQSGETADTLNALRHCKNRGALTVGITNTVGSTISRETHCGVHINAGPEIGVASTKAYTSQILCLTMFALVMAEDRISFQPRRREIIDGLRTLNKLVKEVLKEDQKIYKIAEKLHKAKSLLVMGRGFNYATCMEGALKIKELTYVHCEGIQSGELKHGPLALVDEEIPIIQVVVRDRVYEKCLNALEQIKSRKGQPILICEKGDERTISFVPKHGQYIEVPKTVDALQGILTVIPMQLLSYHMAVLRGCNVDQPRNLAKSVTVE